MSLEPQWAVGCCGAGPLSVAVWGGVIQCQSASGFNRETQFILLSERHLPNNELNEAQVVGVMCTLGIKFDFIHPPPKQQTFYI